MKSLSLKKIAVVMLLLLAFLFVLPFIGCSSKKKTTEEAKQEIKIENSSTAENSSNSESNVKTKIEVVVDDKNEIVTTKKTYSPIDATKPASVIDSNGKKHDLNNANYTEETITQKNNTQSKNSDNSEEFQKKESSGKEAIKEKGEGKFVTENMNLDKSGFNFWSWFWLILIVIIVLVLVYLNYRFKWVSYVTAFLKSK